MQEVSGSIPLTSTTDLRDIDQDELKSHRVPIV